MASSLELLHYLKGYAENTAIAAMFQACYMMQLKRSAGVGDYAPPGGSLPNDTTTSTTDGGGNRKFFMQPGMVFDDLPPETELDLIAPTQPQGVFNDFIKAVSAMSATGAGLDVHRLLRDYSGGNYSSLHLASLDFDKQCSVEDQLYISTWRRRHRALWTELAILEGRLPVRREFYTDPAWRSAYLRADHRSQKRERVDPRADAAADAMDLKNMTKSLPQLVNEWGGDYRENLRSWTESELARVEGKAQIIDRAIERAAVLGVDYHELLPDAPARPLPTGAGRPAESPETATATEGEESDDQRRDG
jgi:capsid protein